MFALSFLPHRDLSQSVREREKKYSILLFSLAQWNEGPRPPSSDVKCTTLYSRNTRVYELSIEASIFYTCNRKCYSTNEQKIHVLGGFF